ncbi:hypothetical protein [Gorillibacterium massiliense]|uniref:hypothetical protein n=1 Tax=Gorillibacterium massiliense TaxID=1280390 RepID=UPI0004B23161|nr:hypothetical protein [Gorillibacterium massiliense]
MIKHRIECFDSDILVCATSDTSFDLTIQAKSNPLGTGNALERYATEEEAIRAANNFCKMYTAAREKGYYFKERFFAKPNKERIDISVYLGARMPIDQFYSQLER